MNRDDFDEIARKVAKTAEKIQRALENSAVVRLQREQEDSPVTAFQMRAEEAAAKIRAVLENWAALESAAKFRDAFENSAAMQAAERMLAFDAKVMQAAETMRAIIDNSAALQAIARAEESVRATVAAQRYLDEQAAQWERLQNSLVHEQTHVISPQPATVTIKARIPKIRISAQAKQEYIPGPAAEPKIEMPPVHWLASALDFVLTKGTFKRTVEPILVDIYDEYFELIRQGDERRSKWIVVRGWFLVIWGQIERPLIAISGWLANLQR